MTNYDFYVLKPVRCHVVELYEHLKPRSVNPSYLTEVEYRIYKLILGKGNHPVFLFVDSDTKLQEGQQSLILIPFDDSFETPEYDIVQEINKEAVGFDAKDDSSEVLWRKTVSENFDAVKKPFLFCLGSPIEQETFEKLVKTENLSDYFDDFFSGADTRIAYAMRTKLISIGNRLNTKMMPYADHSIIVTPTKRAKTTLAEKVSTVYGAASGAGLLGFATAKEVNEGSLQGQFKAITCDEINQKGYPNEFFDNLPNILEQGVVRISKGKLRNITETSSAFMFLTNTKQEVMTPSELMEDFDVFLVKFSTNTSRLGSRKAVILFGNHFEPFELRKRLIEDEILKNKAIVHAVSDRISLLAERVFSEQRIVDWLNTPIDSYSRDLDSLINGDLLPTVADFFRGQKEAYRHIRGMALKQALIDYALGDETKEDFLLHGKYNGDRLIELADSHVTEITRLSLDSLLVMKEVSRDKINFMVKRWENIPQEYAKTLIALVGHFTRDNQRETKFPFIMLEPVWDILPEVFKETYKHYSHFEQKIPTNLDRLNAYCELYGFSVTRLEKDAILITVKNKELLTTFTEALTQKVGKLGNSGNDGNFDEFIDRGER